MIKIKGISKKYFSLGKEKWIFKSISFNASRGEIISIYGPNGSGKSTMLKIIGGILKADEGEVQYDCKKEIRIGYVPQNYTESLFPWYTAEKNIALSDIIKTGSFDNDFLKEIIKILNINFEIKKYPYQFSGGQQQLISIARALFNKPCLLLLDEPFSALDRKIRKETFLALHTYIKNVKPVSFFVSHDLDEAILFSNKIIILSDFPTKILKIINIELNNRRDFNLVTTEKFLKIRNNIIHLIEKSTNNEI